jgi:hypothetical protein
MVYAIWVNVGPKSNVQSAAATTRREIRETVDLFGHACMAVYFIKSNEKYFAGSPERRWQCGAKPREEFCGASFLRVSHPGHGICMQ